MSSLLLKLVRKYLNVFQFVVYHKASRKKFGQKLLQQCIGTEISFFSCNFAKNKNKTKNLKYFFDDRSPYNLLEFSNELRSKRVRYFSGKRAMSKQMNCDATFHCSHHSLNPFNSRICQCEDYSSRWMFWKRRFVTEGSSTRTK